MPSAHGITTFYHHTFGRAESHDGTRRLLSNSPLWDQAPPTGGVGVAELLVLLVCPFGPVPLAARGLAAVLARAASAGSGHNGDASVESIVLQTLGVVRSSSWIRLRSAHPNLSVVWST